MKVIPTWFGLVIVTLMEWAIWVSSMGERDSSPITAGIRYSMINRTYDIEKAKKRLNYKPLVDMPKLSRGQEGLSRRRRRMSEISTWALLAQVAVLGILLNGILR